ncbi:UNVERIFIED_CONTAM: hypothetical protein FKN15_060954 [Acipenser sinensis]
MDKTLKDHLVDTLDDLDEDQLTRFKDKLGETTFQGDKISKGALQKASSLDIAGLLIRTYNKKHAAEITMLVLNAIKESDLAQELKRKTAAEPSPPGEIQIDSVESDSVSLSWGRPAGMDEIPHSFKVTYSSSVKDNTLSITAPSNSTLISKLRPGIHYSFTVTTLLENGIQSTPVSAAVCTKPSPPGEIQIDSLKSDSVSLSWVSPDNMDGIPHSFYILKSDSVSLSWVSPDNMDGIPHSFYITYSSSDRSLQDSITARTNSTVISKLRPGRHCSFTVTTELENGTQSTPVSASVCTKPSPPGEIKIDSVEIDSVSLSWDSPVGIDGIPHSFKITFCSSDKSHQDSITAPSNSTVISELRPGREYSFTVTTVLENGTQSTPVSTTTCTKPSPPGEIKIDSVGSDSVSLSWGSPAGMEEIPHSFKITSSSSVADYTLSITAPSNSTLISKLRPGRKYSFTVTTLLENGTQSTPVSTAVCTKPSLPGGIKIDSMESDSVSLSWDTPVGVDGIPHSFKITFCSSDKSHQDSATASSNSTVISNQRPGREYNFTVTTELENGTQSRPVSIAVCTRPSEMSSEQSVPGASTADERTQEAELQAERRKAKDRHITHSAKEPCFTDDTSEMSSLKRPTNPNPVGLDISEGPDSLPVTSTGQGPSFPEIAKYCTPVTSTAPGHSISDGPEENPNIISTPPDNSSPGIAEDTAPVTSTPPGTSEMSSEQSVPGTSSTADERTQEAELQAEGLNPTPPDLDRQISNSSLGMEHFMREMGQLYEAACSLPPNNAFRLQFQDLPSLGADLLLDGFPLELVDGDASNIPLRWVTDVLTELHEKVQHKSRLLVVTVLGVQSTGKSTLLNTMFGVQFAVSSGRCTRGAFMLLIRIKEDLKEELNCDFILVIDTEGLKSPALAQLEDSYEHDNELATLVVGLSDITIINIAMENSTEMKDILQIVVHAFLRMEKLGKKPNCQFVHQNVGDVSAHDNNARDRNKLLEQLNEMTQAAARMEKLDPNIKLTDVMEYDPEHSNWYIPGLWHGIPPMAPVNTGYSESVYEFKKSLIEVLKSCKYQTLPEFLEWMRSLWKAVKHENFIFSFRNSLVAEAYSNLCVEYGKWEWDFQKHMYNWLATAETRISNTSNQSSKLEFLGSLKKEVTSQEETTLEKLTKYYESKEGHVNLLKGYRATFEISIKTLRIEIENSVTNKLTAAIDFQNGMKKDCYGFIFLACVSGSVRQSSHRYHPCGLTMQPPKSYSVGGQRSSGQLTGKPTGARPDYRGRWCAGLPMKPELIAKSGCNTSYDM